MELMLVILIFMGIMGILFLISIGIIKITEALMWLIYGD